MGGKVEKSNYNSFDLAKLICSVLVVIAHVPVFGEQANNNVLSNINFALSDCLSRIAVPLFFIFNGFFFGKKVSKDNFSFEYAKKYFLHILKLYLIWSLIYFPLNLFGKGGILHNPEGIVLYIKNLVLVTSYTHLWYMNALLFVVALMSFLLYRRWSLKKILVASSVLYIFGLLGDAYYGFISPLHNIPLADKLLNTYFDIFYTTRNGLFFGFFFIALGAFLSEKEFLISRSKALIMFIVSLVLMLAETFVLKYYGIAKDYNVFLFIVPAVLYFFLFLKSVNLKYDCVNMRKISSLIYYSHIWVLSIVTAVSNVLGLHIKNTPLVFLMVLGISFVASIVVVKLSDIKAFRWLKTFY